jgi:hypothetical protein
LQAQSEFYSNPRTRIDFWERTEARMQDVGVNAKDGNGALRPTTRRVFTLLGDGSGRVLVPMGLVTAKTSTH